MKIVPEISLSDSNKRVSITHVSAELLRNLFLHHDGIVVGATVSALHQGSVLERLFEEKSMSMSEIREELSREGLSVNCGYLHVALRCLALQGWITRTGIAGSDAMEFAITSAGKTAYGIFDRYIEVSRFIYSGVPLERILFEPNHDTAQDLELFAKLIDDCRNHWYLPDQGLNSTESEIFEMIGHHLDGLLLGPLMIAAKMHGILEGEQVPPNKLFGSRVPIETGLVLLEHFGWVHRQDSGWRFTELGKLASEFSLHYGLTWSYAPMFCNLPQLIFKNSKNVTHVQPGKEEKHVERIINVLASGVAHQRYFEDSEKMIVELFNRPPLEDQPKFVADMGCGDGEWLKRIYHVVKTRTLRGKFLDRVPLLMIGADYNVKAQEVVQQKLTDAGIPNIVMFGDIGDPQQFAEALRDSNIDISDGLHLRAFIDHNRPYREPETRSPFYTALSTGAYADENGNPISNEDLEQSLGEHFRQWVPYIKKHGLIILEAHNVDPKIASKMLGKTHATAFDTYHGYSNQYPVDFEAFIKQAESAGLRPIIYRQMLYPSRLPFVAISLNHFKAEQRDPAVRVIGIKKSEIKNPEWRPEGSEDLEDGNALHELLYQDGDQSLPRRWCSYATGLLVADLLIAIENRFKAIRNDPGEERIITVVDYGVGTGFATLELIKGLEEKGLFRQFKESGVDFRLPVFDFPSGWFAKAFELLKPYPFVTFHSLKADSSAKVLMLSDLLSPSSVDIVFASMVFHLIPPAILKPVLDSFHVVLKADGVLLWNTPDTAPALTHANVIHTANRMVRKHLNQLAAGNTRLCDFLPNLPENEQQNFEDLIRRFEARIGKIDVQTREKARQRAEKQILPLPTDIGTLKNALDQRFCGDTWVKLSVMTDEELLALALLPANQRNAGEVEPRDLREKVVTLLLKYAVLPAIHKSPAGLPSGMNLHWTFGKYIKQ